MAYAGWPLYVTPIYFPGHVQDGPWVPVTMTPPTGILTCRDLKVTRDDTLSTQPVACQASGDHSYHINPLFYTFLTTTL